MPPVANGRAPKRSDRMPDIGPAMRKPKVSGKMAIPAHNGVRAKSYPCSGNQMPCSQMMSMNIRPPRLKRGQQARRHPGAEGADLEELQAEHGLGDPGLDQAEDAQ